MAVKTMMMLLVTLMLFWISGICWDTLLYFVSSPAAIRRHHLPRHCRRHHRRSQFLRGYPASWLVLSNAVLIATVSYRGHVPCFRFPSPVDVGIHVHVQAQTSFERIRRLDQIVDLTPKNLLRFHRYKYAVFVELFPKSSFYFIWSAPPPMTESFFDCYSKLPIERNGD